MDHLDIEFFCFVGYVAAESNISCGGSIATKIVTSSRTLFVAAILVSNIQNFI